MLFSNTPEFIGRYQVVKELKSGGMGTVFLARDPRIGKHMGGRFIAIKVLQEFDDVELRARFEREADIAGTLDHRNIVQIYDRDEFDGRPFIVMEFVDGRTLSELIDTGTVPLVRKLQWMEELCDGLACAHSAGVVHRDIKPANIMIRALDGVLKILDFGIARSNTIKVNMTRGILGTLNYMAPEQWDSTGTVDSRADAFAAGAVFYELLSGEKAFPGNDVPSIYRQISSQPPQSLEKLHPGLDPDLIAIVNRCLEKRPADRYADMVAVRADLGHIRQRLTARDTAVTLVRPARTFVNEAQRAIEQGDFTLALKAVEQALRMEPDNTAARDLEQRARSAIQVENWLRDARGAFERGALTAASMLVDQILTVNESHPDALSIRLEIEEVRRELERARRIEAAVVLARESLDAGALDEASAACAELLEIDPENADAVPLRQRLDAAIAERRIAEENARAQQAVAEARRQFAAGEHADAMALLERHQPAHATVTAALAELRAEYREIERRRQEAERRRQEEEQRRQEEQRQIAAANERARVTVTEARRLFSEGNHPAALQLLEAHQPPHWDVTAALETLRDKVAELERQRIEEEQRRNEAERRKQEEERERAEAERRKQDQERLEAERRKQQQEQLEAERRKQQQEQLEAERRKQQQEQLEAERRKQQQDQLEAERRKQQQEQLDAQRRKEEADARQRLAAERQKQEEARVEAERRKAEEQRRFEAQQRAAEQARRDEEKRRQAQAGAAPKLSPARGDELTVKLKAIDDPQLEPVLTRPSDVIKPAGEPRAVDWRILATAAVIVMAMAIFGVMKWRSGSSDVPTSAPSAAAADSALPTIPAASSPAAPPASSSAATPPPATTAAPQPEPPPAPTASAPNAPAGPGGAAAIDSQVAALRATSQDQWARDNRDQAMTSLTAALKLKPRDAEASRLASGFIRQMSERASNAATAARNAGAPDTAGSAFDDARRRVRDAAALERAGKPDQSVRAYGDALDLFAKATATAKVADAGRATPPTPTGAPPVTGATGSPSPAGGTSASGAGTPSPPPAVRPAAPAPVAEAPPPAASPSPTPAAPTPAAPAPPAPANVTSAAAAAAAEESAVRQVLQRYRSGYESLNARAVQAVYPSIPAQKLDDTFKLYSSLKQEIEIDRVGVDRQTATVTATVTTAPTPKGGKPITPQKSKAVFSLKKSGDTWLIQDVSFK